MAISITEMALKLWDAWSIRGSILISISLQAFLILLVPLRKGRIGGNWLIFSIWSAYLFADWVAIHTIGLIFIGNSSSLEGTPKDIMGFWASFLLLHLGGPDSITSFSVEDNELWKRHFFSLVLQVGYTIYIFLKSFSTNQLWLPTILVLFAGIVKYLERNVAFYLASFEHFGDNWEPETVPTAAADEETGTPQRHGIPLPQQFRDMEREKSILGIAVKLFGNLKRTLVGPLLEKEEQDEVTKTFSMVRNNFTKGLQVIEIELSLLYEALHTKLPVITTTAGCYLRMATFGCILLALISFSLVKKHYQLAEPDLLLTYVLLIGGLMLEVLSIIVLNKFSDWFAIGLFRYKSQSSNSPELFDTIIKRRRWSKTVPQLNFFRYHVKDPFWLKNLHSLPYIGSLLEILHNWRCQKFQNFQDLQKFQNFQDLHWKFIFLELCYIARRAAANVEGNKLPLLNDVWLSPETLEKLVREVWPGVAQQQSDVSTFSNSDYTELLILFHIATELCYQKDDPVIRPERTDYRSICKLLSDYMFYLAVMQPTMMSTVLNDWSKKFKKTTRQTQSLVPWSLFLDEKTATKEIFEKGKEISEKGKEISEKGKEISEKGKDPLSGAVKLARELINWKGPYLRNWRLMCKVWLELMCYAAINCKSSVHAEQPSRGGELLTFVWLLMNHLGLGTKHYQTLEDIIDELPEEED
ncbi:hypothetical protein SLEP1_g14492 [Rubroshorea leprosula]|uniref:DUF4220 domain-containing protein n=1 Tax=Rubroshorea leprosula TaxID=152421 RepID=A0AAV5IJB0_9ROSI|nr:hypothetical protein SLEP1_g14492 [Rubroshorea leprosula]